MVSSILITTEPALVKFASNRSLSKADGVFIPSGTAQQPLSDPGIARSLERVSFLTSVRLSSTSLASALHLLRCLLHKRCTSYRVFLGSSFISVCIYSLDSFIHLAEGDRMDAGDSRLVHSPEFWHTPNRLHEFPTWWIHISKLMGASEVLDGKEVPFFWREAGESLFGVPVGRWLVTKLTIYHPWFLFFPLVLTA